MCREDKKVTGRQMKASNFEKMDNNKTYQWSVIFRDWWMLGNTSDPRCCRCGSASLSGAPSSWWIPTPLCQSFALVAQVFISFLFRLCVAVSLCQWQMSSVTGRNTQSVATEDICPVLLLDPPFFIVSWQHVFAVGSAISSQHQICPDSAPEIWTRLIDCNWGWIRSVSFTH